MWQVGVLLVSARVVSPRCTAVCIQALGVQRSPSTPLCLGRPCFTPSPTRRRLVPLLGVCFSVCCFAEWHAPVRTCKKLMGVSACWPNYRKCWECDMSLFNAHGFLRSPATLQCAGALLRELLCPCLSCGECVPQFVLSPTATGKHDGARVVEPQHYLLNQWPCGLMDKALVFGTKDCRFESYQGQ